MKVRYPRLLMIILALAFLSYMLWRVSPILQAYPDQNAAENSMLKNFQTVTVEVVFPSSKIKSVLGHNENTLSDLALEIVCSRIKAEFGGRRISCSRYGKPYSFRTNPLNLAIVFQAQRVEGTADKFNIRATFERSAYFSLLTAPDNPTLKEKYKEFKQSGKGDYFLQSSIASGFKSARRDSTSTRYFQDKPTLTRRIEFLSELIVAEMKPDEKAASEQEKEFLNILR